MAYTALKRRQEGELLGKLGEWRSMPELENCYSVLTVKKILRRLGRKVERGRRRRIGRNGRAYYERVWRRRGFRIL